MKYLKYIIIIYFFLFLKIFIILILSISILISFKESYKKNIDFISIHNLYKKNINYYINQNINYFINTQIIDIKKNINLFKQLKIALCVVAKQETLYIKEFIDYYIKLGFNKIFLYDNNELNGETFEKVLNLEIKEGFVDIINFRGIYKPQRKAYNDCYYNNQKYYDWIAFYDVDEYLYILNYTIIQEFLSLSKFNCCSSILINWRYYGDNDKIYYNNDPIQKRFQKAFNFKKNINYNKYFYVASKSIIRGRLNITWDLFPHFLKNSTICSPDGIIIENPFEIHPDYTSAYIKHFATKSTEEYIIKLIKGTANTNFTINIESLSYWLKNYYFLFNKITRKKLLFIKRILKIKII